MSTADDITEPAAKKQHLSPPRNSSGQDSGEEVKKPSASSFSLFVNQKDIWIKHILPFLGMGQYAFVGAVDKQLNQLYKEYCATTAKDPSAVIPTVKLEGDERRQATSTDTFYSAAFCNVSCAKYWFENCFRHDDDDEDYEYPVYESTPHDHPFEIIAKIGNLEVFQWAQQEHKASLDELSRGYIPRVCLIAARNGHLALLKYAHEECGCYDGIVNRNICQEAAMCHGNLEVLKYLRENGSPWNAWTCYRAAQRGDLEMVQWAHEHGCPWDSSTCSFAAVDGHLDVLKWAREHGCPWDSATCSRAAANGHLDVLKWARANGCDWEEGTCSEAARNGHLEVLQWAREQGCPWDRFTCLSAVYGNHLSVLQWARDNGCPWDATICKAAARHGHLEILKWARAHGCPWHAHTYHVARRYGHDEVAQWAIDNGCPYPRPAAGAGDN